MKLRNKKTGEILESYEIHFKNDENDYGFNSLAELNEKWEDYEEPNFVYFLDSAGTILIWNKNDDFTSEKEIGNYFKTREEAEKAVKKLKAWKRLKDKGFKLSAVVDNFFCLDIYMKGEPYEEIKEDLKIVFGDEE